MNKNKTRAKLAAGGTVSGMALQMIRSAEIPRILAAAGFDYIFIDTEHGGFNPESVQDIATAAREAGIPPLVRVTELKYSLVARSLDLGAQGIIFPRVEDADLLREAIAWTRFPPLGSRGFGLGAPQTGYEQLSMPEIIAHANEENLNVVQFETVKALEMSPQLLSIPGVDIAMIGPADLSISMGIPGEFDHPDLVRAIEGLMAECHRHGVVPGIHCPGVAMARQWLDRGMRLVGCGGEINLLLDRATELQTRLRQTSREE